MTWNFQPNSIGLVAAGMSRADVRAVIGSDFVEFKKAYFVSNTTDAFDSAGIHVYYDDQDRVEAVEIIHPAQCDYNGVNLLGIQIPHLKTVFIQRGIAFTEDDAGMYLEGGRLAIYVPEDVNSPDAIGTSVYVDFSFRGDE